MTRAVTMVCVICMGLGQLAFAGDYDKDKDQAKDQAKSGQSSDIYGYRSDYDQDQWRQQDQSWQRDRSDQWRSDDQAWGQQDTRSQYGYMGEQRDRYTDQQYRPYGQRQMDQDWQRGTAQRDWQRGTFRDQARDWQSQQGMRGGRMMGGQSVAIMGRITNEDARVQGANPDNKLVEIRSRRGTTLVIDLGPADEVRDLNLSQNQPVFVRGELSSISGQRVLMAREVGRVSQVTSIDRSREQFSREGRQSQEYGYIDGSERDQGRWSQQQQYDRQRSQQQRRQPGQSGSGGETWYYGEER